ncbi:MAG TPA: protein kinase [Rhodothermales bacterium]|nr:protein kinase [Rhodothermales bacterium]
MGDRRRIGDIQLFAELAQGPTTVVYKGYQKGQERFVLLKMLRPVVGYNEEVARRFEDEARLIAQIDHPNVVTIYAHGREDEHTYLATEFVDGVDLQGLLEMGPLPPHLAAYVLLEAARGLQAAHAKGILHRDLKPSNILIAHNGHVKLTDFGMASLAEDEDIEVRGTPGYLAPEQVRGEPPVHASDLFALGATFYEMLAGRPAFAGSDTSQLLDAVLHQDPLPRLDRYAEVPVALHQICARLLAKTPARRYPDTTALIADLEAVQAHAPADAAMLQAYMADPETFRREVLAPAIPEEPDYSPPPKSLRHPLWYGIGLLMAVVLAGFAWMVWSDPEDATTTATPLPIEPLREEFAAEESSPPADSSNLIVAKDAPPTETSAKDPETIPADQPEAIPEVTLPEPDPTARQPRGAIDTLRPPTRQVPPPDNRPGHLNIDVRPWAEVFINGEAVGNTPLQHELAAGSYAVELKNEDFPTHRTEVTLRPGEVQAINVSLWDKVGRVQLRVGPWADIYVNDVFWDTVPPQEKPLIVVPGTHRLQLRHRELGTLDTTFTIQAGQERLLEFNLTTLLGR